MLDGPPHPAQHAGKPHDKSDLDREASEQPTGLLDWSGFSGSCKQDWWGAPLIFGEVSLGPAALVVFGGIYWGMSTGDVVAVAAIYFEAGIFDDQLYKKDIDPTYKYWSRSTEAGVGIGQESGVSEADFTHPGLELEFVGQIGPLVGVKSRTMWAAFYSTHIAFGGGTLVPLPMLAWSKRIADAR